MKQILLLFTAITFAQSNTIKGNFAQASNKEIALKGFVFKNDTLLASTKIDDKGMFEIKYPSKYVGAAVLDIKDTKSVIVLLNKENFEMNWTNLDEFSTLKFKHSPENNAFANGIEKYQESEAKLSALIFLSQLYENQPAQKKWFDTEIRNQKNVMPIFFGSLPKNSYANSYVKIRKMITDMPNSVSRYVERMPQQEKEFNDFDFASNNLIHSGLYQELLDAYVLFTESYFDKQYPHLNGSIDAMLKTLDKNETLKQDVAQYIFKILEKRSLFPAAEYLALSMLDKQNCQLTPERTALFEQYRKMAVGQIAPDIKFFNSNSDKTKLSEINTKYRLVVFAASWCEKCKEEIPKLKSFYEGWKTKYNLEIILNSLDTYKEQNENFVKDFAWFSSCDYKSWEGNSAREYFVFGTPTIYLLNKNNKILLKPRSPEQIEAWLTAFDKKNGNIIK
jgi:thiol-disulfide isomerase/thioredoxin